ncbi:Long chain acyl-CoA synthetase 5, partial [Tetrabaena socialis]
MAVLPLVMLLLLIVVLLLLMVVVLLLLMVLLLMVLLLMVLLLMVVVLLLLMVLLLMPLLSEPTLRLPPLLPGGRGLGLGFVDELVFRRVRAAPGGKVRLVVCGGAPLAPRVEDFLRVTLGCPVMQGYGLTETCAASMLQDPYDWRQA